jgi:septation ring formation regulator EzrA
MNQCNEPDHGAINAERAESRGLLKRSDAAEIISTHPNDLLGWPKGRRTGKVPKAKMQELERELAAVTEERDELKSKYRTHHDEAERITNEIRRVSSVCRELKREVINWKTAHDIAIEQRDRVQDAIETMLRDSTCRRIPAYTEEQLAAVKGGGDE